MGNKTDSEIAAGVDAMRAREWEERCNGGPPPKKRKPRSEPEEDDNAPKDYKTRAIEFGGVEIVDRDEGGEKRYYEPGD